MEDYSRSYLIENKTKFNNAIYPLSMQPPQQQVSEESFKKHETPSKS